MYEIIGKGQNYTSHMGNIMKQQEMARLTASGAQNLRFESSDDSEEESDPEDAIDMKETVSGLIMGFRPPSKAEIAARAEQRKHEPPPLPPREDDEADTSSDGHYGTSYVNT